MDRATPLITAILLIAAPLGAEPPAPADEGAPPIPQPVLLDWGDQFRLNAPPNNASEAGLERAALNEARARDATQTGAPSRATLGPEDPAKERFTSRSIGGSENSLNVKAPLSTGPVSLGASYGQYRAVPNVPTREVSADDMRVTLGIAF